ncbi:MAG: hypothetical protein U0798_10120 [Gemmataceae bacterium]
MSESLPLLIQAIGVGQLGILVASALVPFQLDWKEVFTGLPRLHRQMYWTYGGYVVLSIVFLGAICLTQSVELASGTPLARWICGYGLVFWLVRLFLQPVFDVKPYLKTWWLQAGYHLLTVLFVSFVVVYGLACFTVKTLPTE